MNGRIILAITQKDVRDAIKNRYLLIGLVLPIAMSLLFRLLFSGTTDLGALPVAVYDPGGSRFTAQLQALAQIKLLTVDSIAQLKDQTTSAGGSIAGIAIPANFDQDIASGKQPELTIYLNMKKGTAQRAAFRELMTQQVWALNPASVPARINWSETSAAEVSPTDTTFRVDSYLLILLLVMSLTMTGAFVVPILLVEEKEKHTMEFLLVSPATAQEVVIGKALTGLVYSAIGAVAMLLLNRGWSGNWPVTILAVLLGALFMVSVGLLMGTIFQTTMQVNTWSSIILLLLLLPTWFTVIQIPPAVNTIIRLIPTYYLADLLNRSLGGGAVQSAVIMDLGVLLASVSLMYGLVIWILRRQET
jgi:ABC-2 type transport system permease protein